VTGARRIARLPVDTAAQGIDGLKRNRFARYLLDVLMQIDAESGAVVGLDGAWGSGKTWVLRQLDALAKDTIESERPVFLHFNPWMVSGSNDLVVALLGQLSSQLAELGSKPAGAAVRATLAKAVKSIDKYAGALVAVKHVGPALDMLLPGVGILVGGAAAAAAAIANTTQKIVPALPAGATRKSLPTLRGDIEASLRAYGRKLVVVVDDLDRIAPTEIASMVQAIKAVAGFPNVVYLLAYEADTLASALERSLGIKDGRAYLEKIVQVPVPMPELPASRIQRFVESRLRDAVGGIEIREHESADLDKAIPLAAALMRSPRDVARIRTRLGIVVPALAGHVNLADIVLVEAVQLKVPALLPWMRANADAVLAQRLEQYDSDLSARGLVGASREDWGDSNEERQAKVEARQRELRELAGQEMSIRRPFQEAIEFLFDSLRAFHSATNSRSNYRRLQRFRHWYRWQCICDHHDPLTTPEVQTLVSDPTRVQSEGWLHDRESFAILCRHVCDLGENDLHGADSAGWMTVIEHAERRFGVDCVIDYGMGLGPAAAFATILRLDPNGREQTIDAATASGSISVVGSLLIDLKRQIDRDDGRTPLVDADRLRQLSAQWFVRTDEAIRCTNWQAPGGAVCPYGLAYWMALLGRDVSTVRTFVAGVLRDKPERLQHFFGSFVDDPVHEGFPLHVCWEILPDASELHALVARSSGFRGSHSIFCHHIDKRASDAACSTLLSATAPTAAPSAA
jgi:KAP family P-loop domain